ncbi:hypothetical protein AM394_22175 [Klebsiella oxytoca]|nr:hypothetical protein AM394_22175 [Klebsiella oxytoca]OLP12920.1 hypothetical protein AGG97_09865 [Klebsiella michiganensis]
MFSMIVLRMKACPQHSTGKEGVTISLNIPDSSSTILFSPSEFSKNSSPGAKLKGLPKGHSEAKSASSAACGLACWEKR